MTLNQATASLLGWVLAVSIAAPAGASPGYEIGQVRAWATAVDELIRGPMDIAIPEVGEAGYGHPEYALGQAVGDIYTTVSLGDGGTITLYLESGIFDGPAHDFAVFENGFYPGGPGMFAEFAFVEVSSDGISFARFDAQTFNTSAVWAEGTVDPDDYVNLAGNQPAGLGTGFDLAELADHPDVVSGDIDLDAIYYVRLVDVIGDGSTLDADDFPIYDPYPTMYLACGFDIDAVGSFYRVPEPAQLVLLGPGILALLGLQRRQCARRR